MWTSVLQIPAHPKCILWPHWIATPKCAVSWGFFEGVVTGAADGYGRMTGMPATTLTHLGPGLGNGLANVHNAKKARTPMVNVIGDHATFHRKYDAPLTSDVEGVARPMSHWVKVSASADDVATDGAEAVQAALSTTRSGGEFDIASRYRLESNRSKRRAAAAFTAQANGSA